MNRIRKYGHEAGRTHQGHGKSGAGLLVLFFWFTPALWGQQAVRTDRLLNNDWRTVANDTNKNAWDGFETARFNDQDWMVVNVPHNWDEYGGYRRMLHGNRHGYAWYRKTFQLSSAGPGKRYFLFFEGVGSYATVWLNGKKVGYHAGGRTTFTIDVTSAVQFNRRNILAVRADHPANITDLPWVCGGCSAERGFSEGSQPMGIFRPVHLMITNDIRIQPFGTHVWNDTAVSERAAQLYYETEFRNYGHFNKNLIVRSRLLDRNNAVVSECSTHVLIEGGRTMIVKQQPPVLKQATLWSLEDPYLYSLVTELVENGIIIDRTVTSCGIRRISWPIGKNSKQFLLNGKPVFINGIAEYEHLLGDSHAFTDEEIRSRVLQIKAAGFNAFRDAHQPHNLRYQQYWDSLGLLWWPQMGAHIWYDSPQFRKNFIALLKDWVKERRNSPSLVLWGLQNESKLPEDFARECTQIIRTLDPTCSSQRLVTTCNGGEGTDWNVPQNWTGTYGGDPATYASDIKKQVLVGEYGAWRTLGLHAAEQKDNTSSYSEEAMTALLETKLRLAEQAKDSAAGQFMWLFSSHDNPGRVQGGEGYRELDRIGPVNYKGLLTPWEEPLDAYYMYRSNLAPKENQPMVYIVSHTWPSRWTSPGRKDSVAVYSNCDEVELFNDVHEQSLGKRERRGIGSHFVWYNVALNYNVLYAVGYVNGKEVATDCIVLNHLPESPHFNQFFAQARPVTRPQAGYHYLYRVNCGGPDYIDENGNTWLADREYTGGKTWGSVSWTNDFEGMPPFFASQQRTFDPIKGTRDWKLFQTFRFGREKLKYRFPVPDGDYLLELYFAEPWLGTGGGLNCQGWRLFDVAVNDRTVLSHIDIWKEAGHDAAVRKSIKVHVTGGELVLSFPHVEAGQAIISAIAVATLNHNLKPAPSPGPLLEFSRPDGHILVRDWLDLGDQQFTDALTGFSALPPELFGAQWVKRRRRATDSSGMGTIRVAKEADVFIGIDTLHPALPVPEGFADTRTFITNADGVNYRMYKKRCKKGELLNFSAEEIKNRELYLVMAQPANHMEPAYDLKPVLSYKSVDAKWWGPGIGKGDVDGKERVIFRKASSENVLEWSFTVGVADQYSLTVSYNNPAAGKIMGEVRLLSSDGSLIRRENVWFEPTRQGKLNYITTNTGTMINAGTYRVRILSGAAEGLSINSLSVQ